MRRMIVAAGGALALVACGEGGGGGGGAVAVVSGGATAATPAPTPTPTPTATATAAAAYPRYASLTGDQRFDTACASLVLGSGLPQPQPAAPFGGALVAARTAASGAWAISGDGVSASFTAGNAVTAPAGQQVYQSGGQQLAVAEPAASGTTPAYTRFLGVQATRSAGTTLYSCVFGVPSLAADVPAASVAYGKVAVTGTAYLTTASGAVQSYQLTASTGTVSYDAGSKAATVRVHLMGYLQTGTTLAATATDLGTFTGTGAVEAGTARFGGSVDGVDRVSLFSSFTGAFFGGSEAGAAFEVLATDTSTGFRLAAVGSVAAVQ